MLKRQVGELQALIQDISDKAESDTGKQKAQMEEKDIGIAEMSKRCMVLEQELGRVIQQRHALQKKAEVFPQVLAKAQADVKILLDETRRSTSQHVETDVMEVLSGKRPSSLKSLRLRDSVESLELESRRVREENQFLQQELQTEHQRSCSKWCAYVSLMAEVRNLVPRNSNLLFESFMTMARQQGRNSFDIQSLIGILKSRGPAITLNRFLDGGRTCLLVPDSESTVFCIDEDDQCIQGYDASNFQRIAGPRSKENMMRIFIKAHDGKSMPGDPPKVFNYTIFTLSYNEDSIQWLKKYLKIKIPQYELAKAEAKLASTRIRSYIAGFNGRMKSDGGKKENAAPPSGSRPDIGPAVEAFKRWSN